MVAENKIELEHQSPQHSPGLTSLLLDKNYKNNYPDLNKKQSAEEKPSRIEAEYQMEKLFMNLI